MLNMTPLYRPPRPVTGIALLFTIYTVYRAIYLFRIQGTFQTCSVLFFATCGRVGYFLCLVVYIFSRRIWLHGNKVVTKEATSVFVYVNVYMWVCASECETQKQKRITIFSKYSIFFICSRWEIYRWRYMREEGTHLLKNIRRLKIASSVTGHTFEDSANHITDQINRVHLAV
jgi:hypothetical protein